jgi:hypothetical protein
VCLSIAVLAAVASCSAPRPTEFVNIVFTPSIPTDHYTTWRFDLDECRDTGDPRVDDAFVRSHLLEAIRSELEPRGYAFHSDGPVDFLVSYQIWFADGQALDADPSRVRGRIVLKDVATGRFVWRGERKTMVTRELSPEVRIERIRQFAHELLQYTHRLVPPRT